MAEFVLKVMVSSLALAIAIKYGGPLLPIAATATNAMIAVWLPSGLMALILLWQFVRKIEGNA